MAPYEDDDVPTLREVSRTLRDFRDEFRLQMGMMVRKDVHAVEHENLGTRMAGMEAALTTRITRLEAERDAERKDRVSMRNQFYLAVVTAGLSLGVALLVAAVK